MMAAKTIGQAYQEATVFDVVVVIILGIYIAIPGIDIPILGDGIRQASFP